MEKREFKIGDKVKIPKTKNKGCSLSSSHIIDKAERENQDYLFIIRIDECFEIKGGTYVLDWRYDGINSIGGDHFAKSDLEHYEEEFVLPKCWFVLYNTKEEFDIINKFYGKGWVYYNSINLHGYHNNGDNQVHTNNWVGNSSTKEKLLKNGYVQITFEQFKKHILKEKTMGKEIKGYVLIKEYPGSKGLGYFEKYTTGELDKYPEFWKPVYEEEFKVGDWVTVTEIEGNGWLNYCSQKTFELKKSPTHYCGGIYWGVNEGGLHAKFRKATPEEIEAAQKQIIKMHSSNKGEFEIEVIDGKAYYRPENKELPKEWIKRIINSYNDILTSYAALHNPYEIKIASIKVGCMEGTRREDWEKVYKLLK